MVSERHQRHDTFVLQIPHPHPPLFASVDLDPPNRTTVEICTAIIAASIPSLKPLFKAILEGSSALSRRTNNKYIGNNDSGVNAMKHKGNDVEMYNSRLKNTAVASAGRRHFDNESEEMILSDQDGIQKTAQVSISIDDPEEFGGKR